jgi:hypothetical protein
LSADNSPACAIDDPECEVCQWNRFDNYCMTTHETDLNRFDNFWKVVKSHLQWNRFDNFWKVVKSHDYPFFIFHHFVGD